VTHDRDPRTVDAPLVRQTLDETVEEHRTRGEDRRVGCHHHTTEPLGLTNDLALAVGREEHALVTACAVQCNHERRLRSGSNGVRHEHAARQPHTAHIDRAPLVPTTPDEERFAAFEAVEVLVHHRPDLRLIHDQLDGTTGRRIVGQERSPRPRLVKVGR